MESVSSAPSEVLHDFKTWAVEGGDPSRPLQH